MLLGSLADRRGLVPGVETGCSAPATTTTCPISSIALPTTGPPAAGRAPSSSSSSCRRTRPSRSSPWYDELGVREALVIEPETRTATLYRAGRVVEPTCTEVLGVAFETVGGH